MKDVDPKKFIEVCKEKMKKVESIKPPIWATFAKTGMSRQLPPQQDDWWYTRAASMLRRIYLDGPVGVERLRTYYGGRKNRGHKPERFRKSGGSNIRKILQQLEKAGLIEKNKKVKKGGRAVSEGGKKFISDVTKEVKKWTT
jgi:small subunit ribosomal protein S19e